MNVDPAEVFASYKALLTGISEDEREQLFELARLTMPKLADYLVEQFKVAEDMDEATKNKVVGATFMFLAFINAGNPSTPTKSLPNLGKNPFPAFGLLDGTL